MFELLEISLKFMVFLFCQIYYPPSDIYIFYQLSQNSSYYVYVFCFFGEPWLIQILVAGMALKKQNLKGEFLK